MSLTFEQGTTLFCCVVLIAVVRTLPALVRFYAWFKDCGLQISEHRGYGQSACKAFGLVGAPKLSVTAMALSGALFAACLAAVAALPLSDFAVATLLYAMKQAMDETVRRGVPEEAARDFLLGHMNILGAVIFKEIPGAFSDACNKAIQNGLPRLLRDDWLKVFDHDEIAESIRRIT